MANQGQERKIKHLRFEYWDNEPNPQDPDGKPRSVLREARQGETVFIPRQEDIDRGERFGAFATEVDEPADEAVDVPPHQMSDQQLIDWISTTRPNVATTVEAAGDDPDAAQRILDAETAATGGDPRDGVVNGLAKVIDRGAA